VADSLRKSELGLVGADLDIGDRGTQRAGSAAATGEDVSPGTMIDRGSLGGDEGNLLVYRRTSTRHQADGIARGENNEDSPRS